MALAYEPALYRKFVAEWSLLMLQGGHASKLSSWSTAAKRAFAAMEEFNRPNEVTERTRILAAIRKAAEQCAGVPHQQLVRRLLADDGYKTIPQDTVRSILKTLGFSWLPGVHDWRKHWEPLLLDKGGLRSPT